MVRYPDIVGNTISETRLGIYVDRGIPDIHGRNGLENNTEYGLYVTGTLPFNVTDNNTFKNNGVGGIYLGTDSNVRIGEDNVIAYNAQCGIRINGGNATVSDRNSVHHNQYGVYMDTTYAPWVRDNNTIRNNSVAGIWISASVGTFNGQIWWNDVRDNAVGISAQDPGPGKYFHAECNWWKDSNGPNDPSLGNPDIHINPAGELVSDYFHYRTDAQGGQHWWLRSPSAQASYCS